MGYLARQQLCDRFVEAFGEDILPALALDGEFVVAQAILPDDDLNVRLHVTVHDQRGDENSLLGEWVVFAPGVEEADAVDAVYRLLHGNEEHSEALADVKARMAAVFATESATRSHDAPSAG